MYALYFNKMEFLVNHTKKHIICYDVDIAQHGWEDNDEIENVVRSEDILSPEKREIFMSWIYGDYNISDEDFYRIEPEMYREILRFNNMDDESSSDDERWQGWDEPGASCDI